MCQLTISIVWIFVYLYQMNRLSSDRAFYKLDTIGNVVRKCFPK